jgi:hypothetical protein
MRKRMIGVTLGAALIVGALGSTPALARSDSTLTVTCSGGQVVVSDGSSLTGQTTANGVYNLVNPFGEICTVNP